MRPWRHCSLRVLLLSVLCLGLFNDIHLFAEDQAPDSAVIERLIDQASYVYDISPDSARQLAAQAYALAMKSGDKLLLMRLSERMADLAELVGNQLMAIDFYQNALEALDEAYQKKDVGMTAGAYYRKQIKYNANLGYNYHQIKKYSISFDFYNKAIKMLDYALEHYPGDIPDVYPVSLQVNIGSVYLAANQDSLARLHFIRALEMNAGRDTLVAAAVLNNLGIIMQNAGNIGAAAKYFRQGLLLYSGKGDYQGMAKVYNNLGKNAYLRKSLGESAMLFDSAVTLADKVYSHPSKLIAYENLAELYADQGKFQLSNQMLWAYKQLHDSLYQDNEVGIQEQQSRMYMFKHALQMEITAHESNVHRSRLTQWVLAFVAFALTMALIVVGLFIRSLRSRNKLATLSNALLQAEKKETDLALREAQRDIELKNKELASSALHITRNSNMVAVIIKELESIQMKHDQLLIQRLIKLVKEIEGSYDKDAWSEFELRFNTVHEAFYTVLQEKFPDLSPAEKRLSALLRMNMTTKEIAAITRQNPDSIKVARYRLRKKLGLTTDKSLVNFLMGLK